MPEETNTPQQPEEVVEVTVSDVCNAVETLQLTVDRVLSLLHNIVQTVLLAIAFLMFSAAVAVMIA